MRRNNNSVLGQPCTRGAEMSYDRTSEFFAVADARCKLQGGAPSGRSRPAQSSFGAGALRVGRALFELEGRASHLSRLAARSSLFDDPAQEIAELSARIKGQMGSIGNALGQLDGATTCGGAQQRAHAEAVLMSLRAGLARASAQVRRAIVPRSLPLP